MEEPWIARTQELLGAYVTKPKLQAKRLVRPPFRFLWDIACTLESSPGFTGFGDTLFTTDEPPNDKDEKIVFLERWFTLVNAKLAARQEPTVELDANSVVCGIHCEATNMFLQSLAKLFDPSIAPPATCDQEEDAPEPIPEGALAQDPIACFTPRVPNLELPEQNVSDCSPISKVLSSNVENNTTARDRLTPRRVPSELPEPILVQENISFQDALAKFNEFNHELSETSELKDFQAADGDPFSKAQQFLMANEPDAQSTGSFESMEECPPSPKISIVKKDSVVDRAQDLLDEIDRELDDVEKAAAMAKEKLQMEKEMKEEKAKKEMQKEEKVKKEVKEIPCDDVATAENVEPLSPYSTQNTSFYRSHNSETSSKSGKSEKDLWGTTRSKTPIGIDLKTVVSKEHRSKKTRKSRRSGSSDSEAEARKDSSKFPKSKRSLPPRAIAGNYMDSGVISDDSDHIPTNADNDKQVYPKSRNSQAPRCIATSPTSPESPERSSRPSSRLKCSKPKYPKSKNSLRARAVASTASTVPCDGSGSDCQESTPSRSETSKYPMSKNTQPPRCVAGGSYADMCSPDAGSDSDTDGDCKPVSKYPMSRTEVHGRVPSSRKVEADNGEVTRNESTLSAPTPQRTELVKQSRYEISDAVGLMSDLKTRLASGWIPYLVDSLPSSLSEKHGATPVVGCLQIVAEALGIKTAVDESVRDLVANGLLTDSPSALISVLDHEEVIEGLQCLVQAVALPSPLPVELQAPR